MTDEELLGRVLHRDAMMLVIDKPAGLAVHAGPKGGDTLDKHFEVLRFGLPRNPELAHRLDRETSGCLVLGRHRQALARLGKLFADGRVAKTYLAVLRGAPAEDVVEIDAPLVKRDALRGWWMRVDAAGKPAHTTLEVLGRGAGLALVALTPHTGRTHQLRVHCAHLGFPILGDRIYGREPAPPAAPPLHLHARRVEIPFAHGKPPIVVTAPLPPHIEATIGAAGLALPEGR